MEKENKRKKSSEFWSATWSCTLGSIIGIIVTFGTTAWLEYSARKDAERTLAVMVINNIDDFCNSLEFRIRRIEREDSLNMTVWNFCPDRLDEVGNDTLQLFINLFLSRHSDIVDYTVENIFSSNIDTWENVSNRRFIESAGKCFSAKRKILDMLAEMDEDKRNVWDVYWSEIYFANEDGNQDLQQIVERIFSTPVLCSYIVKHQMLYSSGLRAGLEALREHNIKNKQMMDITDKDLMQEFGKEEKMKVYDDIPSD